MLSTRDIAGCALVVCVLFALAIGIELAYPGAFARFMREVMRDDDDGGPA